MELTLGCFPTGCQLPIGLFKRSRFDWLFLLNTMAILNGVPIAIQSSCSLSPE
ncbi:MAG: hypothetical protein NT000_04010 [Proteobacteria bacterium]|nr:hypothetical protein [Pseudomonadota bacterium]